MIIENSIKAYRVAVEFLQAGKVVIVPGLSNYSLAANGKDTNAVKRIYEIKKRPLNKPLTLLVPPHRALEYIDIPAGNQKALILLGDPIVLISKVKDSAGLTELVNLSKKTLGVSWRNIMPHKLLYEFSDFPIFGTSLNLSGESAITRFEDVMQKFEGKVDLIINSGDCPDSEAEVSVLDLSTEPPLLLREGNVKEDFLRFFFPNLKVRSPLIKQ